MVLILDLVEEAAGSGHYITEDGCISYLVILRAVSQIMLNSREQNVGNQVTCFFIVNLVFFYDYNIARHFISRLQ